MILYTVYKSDWECPQQIFHTMNKEKAEQFVNLNNQYITDNISNPTPKGGGLFEK